MATIMIDANGREVHAGDRVKWFSKQYGWREGTVASVWVDKIMVDPDVGGKVWDVSVRTAIRRVENAISWEIGYRDHTDGR